MSAVEGPDLVVAGAGGGLVAALRAASLGLSVLVVERNEHFARGNNTAMSTAMVPGAGTRWQREAGVEDSPEQFLADVRAKTHGEADERLAAALAGVSARLLEWLADDVGLPLSLVTDFGYPGHSAYRCHTVPGRAGQAMLADVVRAVRSSDLVDLMVPARLTGVEEGDDGVLHAVVDTPNGEERIPTRAVLLATNGFGADRELVAEHLPEIAGATYHGSEGSTGDALRIGERLGAATAYLDAYQGHAALTPAATLAGWATVMHGAVVVDVAGRRFGDETTGYSEYAAALQAAEGGRGWIVLDERVHEACLSFTDYRDTVESGVTRTADDAAALAAAIEVDPEVLAATLEAARASAADGTPDEHGRTRWEAPLEAPYRAVPVTPALFHTQGGLVVDEHARVLRADGSAVPGLYASGGAAAGISGHGAAGYLAGNGLLPALGLAFLAAEHLAGH
ncbi:FAD-dependent oxidoreductase [Nocardioides lianchengensis]|uniref:Fumarate reductase flavoprotein subunit n=1 Tax=Nocardioides lianchengensis TaxID=1045774 RepID=A0A1G7A8X7_9ACTN|nr:FAD-binding protein [Nocardioides lianchengensis]NYG13670.1 fumarate reductase flavoprotein subunit [Nocardioides lianchengensis]SDE11279.1 fumarate reductase flavoprotein subunit [Nocardioides lianchengensis]